VRASDGRRGRVFSIRVTEEEEKLIRAAAEAAEKASPYHRWGPAAIGPWIVARAVDAARARAGAGTTALEDGSTGSSRRGRKR